MKRILARLTLVACCAWIGLSASALAQEEPAPDYAPATTDADLTPVKEAWAALEATQPELALKLEQIVHGERAGAGETLIEAASILAPEQPELAARLDELAAEWTAGA